MATIYRQIVVSAIALGLAATGLGASVFGAPYFMATSSLQNPTSTVGGPGSSTHGVSAPQQLVGLPGIQLMDAAQVANSSAPDKSRQFLVELELAPDNLSSEAAYIQGLSRHGVGDSERELSPAQVLAKFGPGVSLVAETISYFKGFSVHAWQDPTTGLIEVQGTAGSLQLAFHTSLHALEGSNGSLLGSSTDPSLPVEIESGLVRVSGLSSLTVPRPASAGALLSCTSCIGVSSVYSEYNLNSVYSAGNYGSGAIGLTEECDSAETTTGYYNDLKQFDTDNGLSNPTVYWVGTGASSCSYGSGWHGETDIDLQSAHAMAPDATIYVCLDGHNPTNVDWCLEHDFVNNYSTWGIKVISDSWTGGNGLEQSALATLALGGVTVLSITGDFGSGTATWPATFSNNIAVGGTEFGTSETAWGGTTTYISSSESCSGVSGPGYCSSTGGCFAPATGDSPPAGQSAMIGFSTFCTSGERGIPDISALAWNFEICVKGTCGQAGGTSVASPLWAGIFDVILEATGLSGPITPSMLYTMGEGASYSRYFNDITSGCNDVGISSPAVTGYCAGTGWDPVTGLGSPNVYNMTTAWMDAAIYTGASFSASEVQTDLTVPSDYPEPGDAYEIFVGVYDSNHGYAMAGISARNSVWGFFYADSSSCTSSGTLNWNDYTLTNGQEYTFRITLDTTGHTIKLEVDLPDTTTAYASYSTSDSATSLKIDDTAPCGSGTGNSILPGWALVERVEAADNIGGTAIPYQNFAFSSVKYVHAGTTYSIGSSGLGTFYSYLSPTADVYTTDGAPGMTISTSDPLFTIANQPYSISQSSTSIFVTRGHSGSITGTVSDAMGSICSTGCTVALQAAQGFPGGSGISMSFSPSSSTVSFTYTVTISPSSTAVCGTWSIVVKGTSTSVIPNGYTTIRFMVSVIGCGGGGCVASGTNILTPTGWVKIQNLTTGAHIREFDLARGVFFTGILEYANSSVVNYTLVINHGLLNVTTTSQPIFISNSTYTGWIYDPRNLTLADQLYDPVNNTWISITNLSTVYYATTVYDVVTSSVNDFVADSILLDKYMP